MCVLDEVDRMLDCGFQEDIEKILKILSIQKMTFNHKIEEVQFLLFSATLPGWIYKIAQKFLKPEHKIVDLVHNQNIKTSKTVKHFSIYCQSSL